MELNEERQERYFIVVRRSKKGLSRGSVGRADAETAAGDLIGMVYGGGGSAKSSGTVKKQDTYPLTRHQAQLLLFVSPASRRLELLYNVQLFSAICALAQDDLVVVKHKKDFQPCLVKNLIQIGKKDKPGVLQMLGFELDLVDTQHDILSKTTVPLPFFSAADIVQVAPSHLNTRQPLRDSVDLGLKRKAVSRINSMPALNSRNAKKGSILLNTDVSGSIQSLSHSSLEVGSMAEVISLNGLTVYGVIRWIGVPEGKKNCWAGLELDNAATTCSDGTIGTKRYFTCEGNKALFVPLTNCKPDSRFLFIPNEIIKPLEPPSVTLLEDLNEDVPPVAEQDVLSHLIGRMRGIQGHFNSCYLDATLFSLFTSSVAFNRMFSRSADSEEGISHILRQDIVNRLRRTGFVPAESVMKFRKQLGCKSFATEEKDPEEFITLLLKHVLHIEPLLKIRSCGDLAQGAYTHQIIVEKNQLRAVPSVQQLLEMSFVSSDLKFEEIPSCLIVQMPRFGKKFKMFPKIIPSTELDITDILHCSPRECFLCGRLAEYECVQCLMDHKLQPGIIKQYCTTCNTQVHIHPSRKEHTPQKLTVPDHLPEDAPVQRHQMQLFAVLCINTSHYISFVKYGPNPRSWIFFDSMADRCGDDNNGYNVPVIRSCPEVGDFLSQSEEEMSTADVSQSSEMVRRLLCDSYMCLYQRTE
ncbi:ubiquitin carboxyl-terminal hydrolase CYLD-like isoform X2 [Sinocyclocheilus anshuiensis]|uniref:ubiquitin carboxyl-terminal hydrolase CYLD-like isoform X1 n=1 Tax=Sinocyclocheilus anshuiensis TaxID=1608454 RepID=UPI0007BAA9CD|nr:PREDICTED: ubiquitin carboxyl-terminal hydrolase CYLD-like isoform X1 [Sinocyclocheilus anshuiensis]XP_016297916.1 PREDICTED: ubiquitin carboxyl-terminal hydrolase CYLD-like isoform X2 [Sinocyclocheilus anshuiensis]